MTEHDASARHIDGRQGGETRLDITLSNRLLEITRCNSAFGAFAEGHGIPDAVRQRVFLAVDELLTNTISYGYPGAGEATPTITISFAVMERRLAVTLTDNGVAFDPFSMPEPDTTLALEDRAIGGLGIHLVRNLVDACAYERRGETNIVSLALDLPG